VNTEMVYHETKEEPDLAKKAAAVAG
jgi:hypothetical protein